MGVASSIMTGCGVLFRFVSFHPAVVDGSVCTSSMHYILSMILVFCIRLTERRGREVERGGEKEERKRKTESEMEQIDDSVGGGGEHLHNEQLNKRFKVKTVRQHRKKGGDDEEVPMRFYGAGLSRTVQSSNVSSVTPNELFRLPREKHPCHNHFRFPNM